MDSEVYIRVKRKVIYIEILRIAKACSRFEYFCDELKEFYKVFVNNEFSKKNCYK